MRIGLGVAGLVASLLLLGACGDDADSSAADKSPSEPERVKPKITLQDTLPLNYLWNDDDVVCRSAPVFGNPAQPTEFSVTDAGGEIVAAGSLPLLGGAFSRSNGCVWNLELPELPLSDFYTITVSNAAEATDKILQRTEVENGVTVLL